MHISEEYDEATLMFADVPTFQVRKHLSKETFRELENMGFSGDRAQLPAERRRLPAQRAVHEVRQDRRLAEGELSGCTHVLR